MSRVYHCLVGLLFWSSFPVLLLFVLVTGKHRRGLTERLGYYGRAEVVRGKERIWIHAASIGEIKVARSLIVRLREVLPDTGFVLTTMTIHGRDFARSHLPEGIPVYLAPLDVPVVTGRVVRFLQPTVYVCLETELWPLLLGKIKKSGAAAVLLNGRLSDRSIRNYQRFRFLFAPVVRSYDRIAVIGERDRQRFLSLGARAEVLIVTGNVKDDCTVEKDPEAVREHWRRRLQLTDDADVFIAGSTHATEEEQLLPAIRRFSGSDRVWFLAPRHLQRLPEIEELLGRQGMEFDRLSDLRQGGARRTSLILIDTMGDLAELYALATAVFIGGSLIDYGGHNVMEAARWNTVVFFGPSMHDFQDAAQALEADGGGIRIASSKELTGHLHRLLNDRQELADRARQAGETARRRRGAIREQAALVVQAMDRG